jgi:hypothetical protein
MATHHFSRGLLALLGAATVASFAATPSRDAGRVDVSYLVAPSVISLRGPVLLRLSVKNQLAEPIKVRLGRDRKENFSFTLQRPDGTSNKLSPLPLREGLFDKGNIALESGEHVEQQLVLNEWTTFSVPGTYQLEVRLLVPIETASGVQVHTNPYHATFQIAPYNQSMLVNACEELTQQIEHSVSAREARDAALALAHVDDELVVPYLKRALDSGKYVDDLIMKGLERVGNQESAQVLIAILGKSQDPTLDVNSAASSRTIRARQALQAIEKSTSDEHLRHEIRRALADDS